MKRSFRSITLLFLWVFFCFLSLSVAQESAAKKVLTIADYARWRTIASVALSQTGEWFSYGYNKREADDTLYVQNRITNQKYQILRATSPQFSDDSRWVAYTLNLPYKEAEKLRKDKKPVPVKAELMNLTTGKKYFWDNLERSAFAKGSRLFAVKKTKSSPDVKNNGTDLIIFNLTNFTETLIGSVREFAFNKPGAVLAYTVDAADKNGNGIFTYTITGVITPLDNDTLDYARLSWNEDGTAMAVLKGLKKKGKIEKENTLLAFTGFDKGAPEEITFTPADISNFPKGMVLSERRDLTITPDASKIFFGIKEQDIEIEKKSDDPLVADVDIFHWKDERLQSVQKLRAETDHNFTYVSVLHLKDKRFVQLADSAMRTVNFAKDGKWGLGRDDRAYISDWKESMADYYRVNTETGERTPIIKSLIHSLGISTDGKRFMYWRDGHIWMHTFDTGVTVNLTKTIPVSFANKEWDYVGTRPSYGITGYTKDGKAVILTNRYDLWLVPFDGSTAINLTNGDGDKNEIRFRSVSLDPEEEFIDLSKPILLTAYGEWTKKAGFYELNNGKLNKLIYDDKAFGRVIKAKNADVYLYTIETFIDFPNYYISDTKFTNPQKITDANPWQSEYKWGHRILFDFKNKKGVRLQGTLAIPDDYQPGQKLPMLVQFYEKNSQNLNRYSAPRYASSPQFAGFVSEGYLVMQPDIHFNTGTSHSDMLECVEAAVQKVIEMGYADPKRIGLHGHSYSGGGAAYIATRSKMFAAVVAGAAPIDLVSEFNELFRGSGQNNHQYDIYGQGRYGTNPYDNFELFWNQSPISGVRTMNTPLLYLHGTDDPTVEYLQGMEFYNALRFNGKPVIFLSYPGEGHSLSKLENQKDFLMRMQQFYDHYLKDKPAPDWMINGVPYLKKGKN